MEAAVREFGEFLSWEQKTKDTIDFKKVYVDMAGGDVLAGLVLSEIIYWYLPAKDGSENKLRVIKKGKEWIAATRYEWWDRVRLSPRQTDRALKLLVEEGVIEKSVMRFSGKPTIHVRIIKARFMELWDQFLNNPAVNPFLPNGENNELTNPLKRNNESVKTLTESTAKTTTKPTLKDSATDVAANSKPDTKPVKEPTPVEDTDPSKERNKGINAIIKAWVDQTRYLGPPDKPYKNKTHRDHAGALYDAGVTPYEVQSFISECQGDKYKPDAPRFIWVCENIGAWRARQGSPTQTVQAFIESDDEDAYVHEPITSPLIQSLVQQVIKGTEAALKGETIEDKSA